MIPSLTGELTGILTLKKAQHNEVHQHSETSVTGLTVPWAVCDYVNVFSSTPENYSVPLYLVAWI